jgi:Domain of unknown function (DUF5753)
MDPKVFEQRVEARVRRQRVLEEDRPPRYRLLLDEAVLYRRVGGSTIMAAQLDKIIEAERNGKATTQIIPFDIGVSPAQDSNFVLLEFGEESDMKPIVFVEGLTGNQYFEHDAHIDRYREAIGYLRDSALSPRDSISRMIQLREVYGS